ncbi:hypothetical protein BC830DRAFT_1072068 [Chytriomyces sp. MP71]|nr:hypothetical protein BC830DRAFT_1072068 [Chytriomyces sp. MP71]
MLSARGTSGSNPGTDSGGSEGKRGRIVVCRFFLQGRCKKGGACSFAHDAGSDRKGKEPAPSDDNVCAICYEPPATFALLLNCDHVFCYTCAQHWRNRANKEPALADSDAIKACPVCRVPSLFVVKSSILPRDTAHKDDIVQVYRDAMARKPCRYFSRGPADTTRKRCPFGESPLSPHLTAVLI